MTQILIVTEEKTVSMSLQRALFDKYQMEVLLREDAIEAVSMMGLFPTLEMVVCKGKFAGKIIDYILKNKADFEHDVKVVVFGDYPSDYQPIFFIPNKTSLANVVAQIAFLAGKEDRPANFEEAAPTQAPKEEPVGEKTTVFKSPFSTKQSASTTGPATYVGINIRYFTHLVDAEIDFNLYSRLKKGDGYEYNIKIASGSHVVKADMERMVVRGGRELYVLQQDFKRANEFLSTHFLAHFKKQDMDLKERMILNSDSYEILLDVFKNNTIDRFSVEIIKELLRSIDTLVKMPSPYDVFVTQIKQPHFSYGYLHSYMSCMLLLSIIDRFPWSQDQSKNKIIYMALFHDLSLHNDRLIKAHHSETEREKLSAEDKKVVHEHADAAALILETIVKSSQDVPALIRGHHGMRSGKGFPDSQSLGILPVAMAYIVIEDFVTHYLDKGEAAEESLAEILEVLKGRYLMSTYADVVLELQKFLEGR